MIQSVHCKNFQSLKDVELEFGKFTVIVGATSSGKSAIVRALRAIADNDLSTDKIMQGTKHTSVAITTDSATVTIERSLGGTSVYKIAQDGSEESSFTKLNRQVPTQVTEALGILPSTKEVSSISFASQHDAPYLLTESSSNAARILGELTNVSTIFAAVREASKRAKSASTLLNLRKTDYDELITQISDYRDINVQSKAISKVEQIWDEISDIQSQSQALDACVSRAVASSEARRRIKILPDPPSLQEVLKQQETLREFKVLLRKAIIAKKQKAELQTAIVDAQQTIVETEDMLHNLLTEAGQCPLCLQEVM